MTYDGDIASDTLKPVINSLLTY